MVNTIKVVCFSNTITVIKVLEVEPNKMFRFPEGTYYWCYIPVTESKNPAVVSCYSINLKQTMIWDTEPFGFLRVYGDLERYCTLEVDSYDGEELDDLKERFKEYSDWDREYTVEPYDDDYPDDEVFYRALLESKGYLSPYEMSVVKRYMEGQK
jgi:hypothetical protein